VFYKKLNLTLSTFPAMAHRTKMYGRDSANSAILMINVLSTQTNLNT